MLRSILGTLPTPIITTKGGRFSDTITTPRCSAGSQRRALCTSILEYSIDTHHWHRGVTSTVPHRVLRPDGDGGNFTTNTAISTTIRLTDTQSTTSSSSVCRHVGLCGPVPTFSASPDHQNGQPAGVIETDGGLTLGAPTERTASPLPCPVLHRIAPNISFSPLGTENVITETDQFRYQFTGLNLNWTSISTGQIATTPPHRHRFQ